MTTSQAVASGLMIAFAVVCLVAIVVLLFKERRGYEAKGKARSWTRVRLASTAILPLTAAAVVLPARQMSDMGALAVFYGLLFTLAPLLWFGLHWLAGRAVRPALTSGESLQLALAPLIVALGIAILAHRLQPVAWALARAVEQAMSAQTPG